MKTIIQTSQGKMKLRPNVAKLIQAFDNQEKTKITIDGVPYQGHVKAIEIDRPPGEVSSITLVNLERVPPHHATPGINRKREEYNPIKTQGTERTREQLQPSRKIATK